jgi:hypothetical protein
MLFVEEIDALLIHQEDGNLSCTFVLIKSSKRLSLIMFFFIYSSKMLVVAEMDGHFDVVILGKKNEDNILR